MGAATAGAIAAVAGDVIASSSAQAINAANQENVTNQDIFNAQQANVNRNFQEDMANTAMQRRVVDLKAAGLNPGIAYQQGGAAAPSGSTASSVGVPSLQNPGAAFGQLGSQITSAEALNTQKAQVALLQAQANKANVESDTEIPAMVDKVKSETGLNDVRAQEAARNVQMLSALLDPNGDRNDYSLFGQKARAGADMATIQAAMAGMSQQEMADTLMLAIKARNNQNLAAATGSMNLYMASNGWFGQLMAYVKQAMGPATSAVNATANLSYALEP